METSLLHSSMYNFKKFVKYLYSACHFSNTKKIPLWLLSDIQYVLIY